MATKLLIEGAANRPRVMPDRSLLRLLAQAHQYRSMVLRGGGNSITELAADAGSLRLNGSVARTEGDSLGA